MAQAINYVLLKYSRSYSSDDPARFSNQPTSSDSEWQHFANPKLQLLLDDGSRSANVKITWAPVGNGLQHVQQENIAVLVCAAQAPGRVAFLTPNYRKIST